MSLESRFDALKVDLEAWWTKHVYHPEVGSIAQAHLLSAKPELDGLVAKFTDPEPVTSPEAVVAAAVASSPAEFAQVAIPVSE